MSWARFMAYLGAAFALAIAPGPDNCFVLAQSAGRGTMAGIYVTLGLISGLSVHITLALLGAATLLQRFPKAMVALSTCGAFYLLFVAVEMLFSAPLTIDQALLLEPLAYYRRGILLNLSNPKVILFFLAFIPQFVSPQTTHPRLWLFSLGMTFAVVAFGVMSLYACLGGMLAHGLQHSPFFARALNLLAALAIGLVAVWILLPLWRKKCAKKEVF
jgi:threonine/homoserine/homoserine lactone efflux protein